MTVVHDPLLSPTSDDASEIPLVIEECQPDPPPPYPSRRRERRQRRRHRDHAQQPSTESDYASTVPDEDATETTPFLSPRSSHLRRPRALSFTSTVISTVSAAPSFAQSVVSAFQSDDEDDDEEGEEDETESGPDPLLSGRRIKRYFRPLGRVVYWKSLCHLMLLNFPYAVLAWVYLFVFTLTGTALLMALPVGAVLCFVDLIGARVLSRGELFLQSHFHGPLAYPLPYPPRPIFTRYREPTEAELEAGLTGPIKQTSFYKNTYAMFTDSTSYQALFYFLVIKASITLLLTVLVWIVVPVSLVLVVPAPAMFRAVRKLGIWQANIAVEGLYFAVR